jgi:hypothetical protein
MGWAAALARHGPSMKRQLLWRLRLYWLEFNRQVTPLILAAHRPQINEHQNR